jgi:predicted ribosomally synthesized peptide with SipW-like signal peptide
MKKILFSIMALVMVIAMAGSAFAYFTDTATSNNNTFTAGTLALNVNANSSADTFSFPLGDLSNFAPGDQTALQPITIVNSGNLNLGWLGYFELSGVTKDMDKAIYIKDAKMTFVAPSGSSWTEPEDHFIVNGTGSGTYGAYYTALAATDPLHVISLRTWNLDNAMGIGGGVQNGAMKPGFSYVLTLQLGMAPEAGNDFQAGTITVDYIVKATQVNAAALSVLDAADARISIADPTAVTAWMNTQISHQNTP